MGGFAWVTLATNDSYSLGALVLAHSLKQVGTQQQLAVLVTPGVTNAMRTKLAQVFNVVQEVNILDSKDETNLRLLKRPELGITFTKLHCWRLTQFDKCVFLDADTLVLENCDELFEREELSAAPDVGWPDCFNSGVFVYRPSNDTYEKLIQFALEKGSFDGGDQGLLNLYFSDWAHKDISRHLPFIYNMCSTACYSYLPAYKQFGGNAKIIHFIGATKPWLQYFDTESKTVHPSEGAHHIQDVLQRWWNIFCSLIHPNLTPDMTSSQDTVHGSPSNIPNPMSYTPHYGHHHTPTPMPDIPTPAEDYQNVWDPWEEYDLRQSQKRPSISNINHHHFLPSQEHVNVIENPTQSFEQHNQTFEVHAHSEDHCQTSNLPENQSHTNEHSHSFESNQQNLLVESHNTNAYFEAGDHDSHYDGHHDSHYDGHHDSHYDGHHDSHYDGHHDSHYDGHYGDHHDSHHDSHHGSHDVHHDSVVVDSHNVHPPTPTYSQPHFPQNDPTPHIHYEPAPPEKSMTSKPPPIENSFPRLPDECVATTTVSNEITLYTSTIEDTNDNNSGLAGAFAQLTLGTARTPEQSALDDHLRRQGWEVGNIDYLGRDSFENIWSKICETLSSGPDQPASEPKAPSPPVASEVKHPEQPAVEVISENIPAPEPEKPQAQPEPIKEDSVLPEKLESAVLKPSSEIKLPQEFATPEAHEPTPSSIIPQSVPESPKPEESDIPQSVEEVSSPKPDVQSESPKLAPEAISDSPIPAIVPASGIPTPDVAPVSAQATETIPLSAPIPESSSPTPETDHVSSTPAPETVPVSPTSAPETIPAPEAVPASPTPAPETVPASPTPVLETLPASPSPAPEAIPASSTPAPEAVPASSTPAPETVPASPTPILETVPASPSPAPETVPTSPTPAPETVPASPTPAPETIPASPTLTPETISASPTPTPEKVPASTTPTPETVPATTTPAPEPVAASPAPAQEPVSVIPTPGPEPVPVTSAPAPEPVPASPAAPETVPVSPKSAPKPVKPAPQSPKPTPESPKPASESPKSEAPPQVCPIAPKSVSEKKSPAKKSSSKEAPQPPKADVTEATPPTSPVSPLPKQSKQQALVVDTSVPDTPPPASSEAAAATPTPPPRKSSGAPKKTTTKTKK